MALPNETTQKTATEGWFYSDGTQIHGPLSSRQLADLAVCGQIRRDYPVKKGNDGHWHLASQIKGLVFTPVPRTDAGIATVNVQPSPVPAHREPMIHPTEALASAIVLSDGRTAGVESPFADPNLIMTCQECGEQIMNTVKACPGCGYPIEHSVKAPPQPRVPVSPSQPVAPPPSEAPPTFQVAATAQQPEHSVSTRLKSWRDEISRIQAVARQQNTLSLWFGGIGFVIFLVGSMSGSGVTTLIGAVLFCVGTGYLAMSRGRDPALGILGIGSLPGLCVISLLPNLNERRIREIQDQINHLLKEPSDDTD